MADVEVQRLEHVAHLKLGTIAQACAHDRFEAVRDGPGNGGSHHVEVEMQFQRDGVVEPETFAVKRLALHHAKGKCDQLAILPPQKEAGLVGHTAADLTKIVFCQLLKPKFRSLEYLLVEDINLIDGGFG